MRKLLLGMVAAATLTLIGPSQPSQAQILLVTGNYRVTEVDPAHERFGVALPEAKPITQNWVYMAPHTEVDWRVTNRGGWHKDEHLSYTQFFEQIRPGTLIRVHGGRRWDGEISGKKVWIGFPDKMAN